MSAREVMRTVVTVVAAVVTTLCITTLTREPRAFAQAPRSPLAGLTLHVSALPDGVIFTFVSDSGEIWQYVNEEFKRKFHYRVREMGQPLEKLAK